MAIDSVRILADSAGHLWQRLDTYGPLDIIPTGNGCDDWLREISQVRPLNRVEELQLRRDYSRLYCLLTQIEILVKSKSRAVELVRARATNF